MGRRPHNRFSHEVTEKVVKYITNFTEVHGICLPGRIPGFSQSNIKLLPSHETKASVYRQDVESITSLDPEEVNVGYHKFCQLWRQLVPFIKVVKPMKDLCWYCQQSNSLIIKAANKRKDKLNEALKRVQDHIHEVQAARDVYREEEV